MHKAFLRNKAIELRQDGYSYELIRSKIDVSKSTLSEWLTKIPFKPNNETLERMKRGQTKSSEILKTLRLERNKKARLSAKTELGVISKRDLMLLGIGLYIGEGAKYDKGCIQFSNSDPKVIRLMMNWFTKVLGVDISNFRAILHLYPDNNLKNSLLFWSKLTMIPIVQFNKTYVDQRLNKSVKNNRKLPYGTIHIRIRALGNKDLGTLLYQKILGWIDLVEEDKYAGIV